jgi:glycosyltransferase involved in cell wall biosynthesis
MTEPEFPLVSAITLIGQSTVEDIVACIDCFQKQTYPYKELIIVNNAENQFAASELNIRAQPDVFLIDLPSHSTTGLARNHGLSASNGQIIAQFDVDYWHHPNRLEVQVAILAQQQAQVSFLSKTLKYSFVSGRTGYHTNSRNIVLGTMVHIRQKIADYPSYAEKNEEWGFLQGLLNNAKYKPVSIEQPELCCKLFFTSEARITEPINTDLPAEHLETIKKFLADRQ